MKFNVIEGISNFNDSLRQDVLAFFEEEWEKCKRKRKAGWWIFEKTYTDNKTGKRVEVVVLLTAKRVRHTTDSYVKSRIDANQYGAIVRASIVLNLTQIDTFKGKHEQYYSLLSSLEHELTHISQKINKSLKDRSVSFKAYQNAHADWPVEKEAELVSLFGMIKRYTPVFASRLFFSRLPYWNNIGFGYKTFLKKAADYGLTNEEVSKFMRYVRERYRDKNIKTPIPILDLYPDKDEDKI
jgi:hypothetical protein